MSGALGSWSQQLRSGGWVALTEIDDLFGHAPLGARTTALLELPRGIRLNAVAPGWVRETLLAMRMHPSPGVPAAKVAQVYAKAAEGSMRPDSRRGVMVISAV